MTIPTPFFTIVDDLRLVRKYRRSFHWNYFYHMAMAILACTNIIFFIYNWYEIKIVVDQTTLMLTFLGFLFAFAGINIYSIFNTNVEAEKEALRELAHQYEESLQVLDRYMANIKKLGVMQQIGLLITTTPRMTIQHYSWIQKCKNLFKEQEHFLNELYNKGARKKAIEYMADLTDICQGISGSLAVYIDKIQNDTEYFFGTVIECEDRQDYIRSVADLKATFEGIESFDFQCTYTINKKDKVGTLTIVQKLVVLWNDVKNLFRK